MLLPFNNISIQNKNMKVRLKNMFDLTHQKQEKKRGRTRKSTIFQKIMNSMGNCNTLCHFTVQCTKRLASHRRMGTNAGVVDEVLKALHFDGDLPHTMRIFQFPVPISHIKNTTTWFNTITPHNQLTVRNVHTLFLFAKELTIKILGH